MSDIRSSYRENNPACEVALFLGLTAGNLKIYPKWEGLMIESHNQLRPNAVNHIWSLGRRPDLISNLITLTADMHDWFHANLPAGRVLCLCAKLRKAQRLGLANEFRLHEINAAAGKNVIGVVGVFRFGDAWIEKLRVETLTRLCELEREAA